jgi:anti-anti-sigma factor
VKPRRPDTLDRHLISISRLRVDREGAVSVLRLRGGVGRTTQDAFRERLADAAERSARVVLDLSELETLSGPGLGILLERARLQAGRGGWLRIASPSSAVRLSLQGFGRRLPVYPDTESAALGLAA